jgi:hypothetical protein
MATSRHSVMLSSTFKDLDEHRAAVSRAILAHGMFPLAMENDSAIPHQDTIDASLAKVEQADAYVGLIGYRYGQQPESGKNPDRLSLTELEFRRAGERGIPRCMFIMHDEHNLKKGQHSETRTEGDEAHRKLAAFIVLAKQDRIYAEFESVADLDAKIHQTLAGLGALLDRTAPVEPASTSRPVEPQITVQDERPDLCELNLFKGQGATPESFELLVELILGQQTEEIGGILFGAGLTKVSVKRDFEGCETEWEPNAAADDGDRPLSRIPQGWEVGSPPDILKGSVLGNDPLCRLRQLDPKIKPIVRLTVRAYDHDMKVQVVRTGKQIPPSKRAILEQFVKDCLKQRDGSRILSTAQYEWV